MKPPILIAGFSHIACFGISINSPEALKELRKGPPPVLGLESLWPRDIKGFPPTVAKHAAGKNLILSWSGNEHMTNFLFAPDPLFDFKSSRYPNLPMHPGAEVVPEALVQTAYVEFEKRIKRDVDIVGKETTGIWLIGPPPPKKDEVKLRAHFTKPSMIRDLLIGRGFDPETQPFTPKFIRLKLWGLLWDVLERCAAEMNVEVVRCPEECFDEEGFLKAEYSTPDIQHANRAYGDMFLPKILERIALKEAERSAA